MAYTPGRGKRVVGLSYTIHRALTGCKQMSTGDVKHVLRFQGHAGGVRKKRR